MEATDSPSPSLPLVPLTRNQVDCERPSKPLHLIILLHGYLGKDTELGYLKSSLEERAGDHEQATFVVHSAKCNVRRTHDGIAAGGKRLASEVMQLIQKYRCQDKKDTAPPNLSLSFVGHSLGGLYARYALSKIDLNAVQPILFCTTATPHLGITRNTYIPLPRQFEWIIAHVLRRTGKDLFGFTSMLQALATDPIYIRPLQAFSKRIAYANAFGTDFQVPTATAAILSRDSDYPHHLVATMSSISNEKGENKSSEFMLTVEAPQDPDFHNNRSDSASAKEMSIALNSLGWTKVLVDNRDKVRLPAVPCRCCCRKKSIENLLSKREWSSQELCNTLSSATGLWWHFPMGHSILVANSKSCCSTYMSAKGRRLVDQLAADMIQDILDSFIGSNA